MRKAEYHRYLASREWAVLKTQIRERSGGRCERCEENTYDQTHHVTYERVGRERLEDLQALCEGCHAFLSGKSDEDPRPRSAPNVHRRVEANGAIRCFCGAQTFRERARRAEGSAMAFELECDRGHRMGVAITLSDDGFAFIGFEAAAETQPSAIKTISALKATSLDFAWHAIVTAVMQRKAILGSILRHACPLRITDGVLHVGLCASAFHLEMLKDEQNVTLIIETIQKYLNASRFEVVSA